MQDKAAEVQAKVDLAIAKADSDEIEFEQWRYDDAKTAKDDAFKAKNMAEANRLSTAMLEIEDDQNKAIDRAARHRCNR